MCFTKYTVTSSANTTGATLEMNAVHPSIERNAMHCVRSAAHPPITRSSNVLES